MWYEDLSDIPDQDFITTIKFYRRENFFFPNPAEIRKYYRQICHDRKAEKNIKKLPFPGNMEPMKLFIKKLRALKKI